MRWDEMRWDGMGWSGKGSDRVEGKARAEEDKVG